MSNVREELTAISETEQKENETWPKFANRLVRAIDKKEVPEEDWAQLSPEAQTWYNDAVEAMTANAPIRTFPGEEPAPASSSMGNSKPKREKKEKVAGEGNGRPKKLADEAKITILVDKNPQREGSAGAGYFEKYKNGQTVKEALEAGVTRSHMNWAVDHGWIKAEV